MAENSFSLSYDNPVILFPLYEGIIMKWYSFGIFNSHWRSGVHVGGRNSKQRNTKAMRRKMVANLGEAPTKSIQSQHFRSHSIIFHSCEA